MTNARVFLLGLLALTGLAVLVPADAAAQSTGQSRECSVATIVGDWAFKTDGAYSSTGVLDGNALGILDIHADGSLRGKYDWQGPSGFFPGIEIKGTVTINADCTGTLNFENAGSDTIYTQSIVVAHNGKQFFGMLQDPAGSNETYTAIRVHED